MLSINPSASSTPFMAHTTYRLRKTCPPRTKIASVRQSRAFMAPPSKDSQNKDSINVGGTEYVKNLSNDQKVRQASAAFNPEKEDPEVQRETVSKGESNEGSGTVQDPLDVSLANPAASKHHDPSEGGAEASLRNTLSRSTWLAVNKGLRGAS